MSRVFSRARVLFMVVGLILALIPMSALTSEASGTSGHIGGIYYRDMRYEGQIFRLEGKTLPSAIGTVDTLVSWHNDSSVAFTGHLNVIMTKPDGSTLIVNVGANQETNLAPGDQIMVEFELPIDQSGPWVMGVQLTDFATGQELDNASASFTVAGISPAFEGDPRDCDAPCSVIFTNLVTGGALPYRNVSWNFGDGTVVEDDAVYFKETVTHNYAGPGVFDVTLQVWDDENSTASHVEVDYITIHERVEYTHTWSFSQPGFFPRHLPDSFTDEVVLAELVPDPPDQVQGVYLWDDQDLEWKFWSPGVPGITLQTLGGGHLYDYMVGVAGRCDWEIPLQ